MLGNAKRIDIHVVLTAVAYQNCFLYRCAEVTRTCLLKMKRTKTMLNQLGPPQACSRHRSLVSNCARMYERHVPRWGQAELEKVWSQSIECWSIWCVLLPCLVEENKAATSRGRKYAGRIKSRDKRKDGILYLLGLATATEDAVRGWLARLLVGVQQNIRSAPKIRAGSMSQLFS